MAKKRRKKTDTSISEQVAEVIENALEPIKKEIDELKEQINTEEDSVKIDGEALEEIGVETPEELEDLLDEAADLAIESLEADGEIEAVEEVEEGLDVAEIVEELVKRRKRMARKKKFDIVDLDPATVEEVAEIIEETAIIIAGDEEKSNNEEDDEEKEDNEETEEKGKNGKKSSFRPYSKSKRAKPTRRKSAVSTRAINRKYSRIYMQSKDSQKQEKAINPVVALARAVKCSDPFVMGGGRPDPERAAHVAKTMYKDASLERQFKSMSVTQPSAGGVLVPQDVMNDIIPMLYDNTVIMKLGASKLAMPHGNMTIPRQQRGMSASWGGEARNINASQPEFGDLVLRAKRLQGMIISTEELMFSTDYSTDMLFGNDIITQMHLGLDWGGLAGKGTEYEPLGIINNKEVIQVDCKVLGASEPDIADTDGRPAQDLPIYVVGLLKKQNVLFTSAGWTFNSDMEQYLKRLKNAHGDYVWKDDMENGYLDGVPYEVTNQILTDEDGYTNAIFGNWNDLLIGEQFGLNTRTSYDATVATQSGNVNTFQSVQTATRATMYADIGLRYNVSFANVKNIKVVG